jgi:hypothetical protein
MKLELRPTEIFEILQGEVNKLKVGRNDKALQAADKDQRDGDWAVV